MTRMTDRIGMNATTIVPRKMITKKGMTKRRATPSVGRTSRIPVIHPSWKLACCAWHKRCRR